LEIYCLYLIGDTVGFCRSQDTKNEIDEMPFFLADRYLGWNGLRLPRKQVVESCLTIEAVAPSIRYIELRPINYNLEEDSGVTSMTFIDRDRQIGTWESPQSKDFGVVYNGRKIRQRDVIKLGPDQPTTFDPTLVAVGHCDDSETTIRLRDI
jgi:hypothetical protein